MASRLSVHVCLDALPPLAFRPLLSVLMDLVDADIAQPIAFVAESDKPTTGDTRTRSNDPFVYSCLGHGYHVSSIGSQRLMGG